MRSTLIAVTAVVVLACLLAGCGGVHVITATTKLVVPGTRAVDQGKWPPRLRQATIEGCRFSGNGVHPCECAADRLEEQASPDEVREWAHKVSEGQLVAGVIPDRLMLSATVNCGRHP